MLSEKELKLWLKMRKYSTKSSTGMTPFIFYIFYINDSVHDDNNNSADDSNN